MTPFNRNTARRRAALAAAILAAALSGPACAGDADTGWGIRPEFHLAGITNHVERDGGSSSYDTLAATLEFTLHSDKRPYWGGPFVDYRASSDERHDDQRNIGAYFRYNWPRWDATGWLFVNRSGGGSHTWLYATRLRYRVAGSHKLGIEAMAPLEEPGSPMLMGGYYGMLSDSVSVKLLGGTKVAGAVDFSARIELVWNVY